MESNEANAPAYPLQLEVPRAESQSRLTNFPILGTMIRAILAIPHLIILYFLQIVAGIVYFIATFAILFTGRYPRGMFDFAVGVLRWNAALMAYIFHLLDDYPPFSMDPAAHRITFLVEYPEGLNRILNFPLGIGGFIKTILLIPHLIIVSFLVVAMVVVILIAEFAILFTGSFPPGLHSFVTGVFRWYQRMNAYLYALTDAYPPFSLR